MLCKVAGSGGRVCPTPKCASNLWFDLQVGGAMLNLPLIRQRLELVAVNYSSGHGEADSVAEKHFEAMELELGTFVECPSRSHSKNHLRFGTNH